MSVQGKLAEARRLVNEAAVELDRRDREDAERAARRFTVSEASARLAEASKDLAEAVQAQRW